METLAGLQVLLALAAATLGSSRGDARIAMYAATLLAFSVAAVVLLATARDRRALALGAFYLLAAAAFARPILYFIGGLPAVIEGPVGLLRRIPLYSFAPYFFWLFILDFPRRRPFERFDGLATRLTQVALAVGLGLCLLLVLAPLAPNRSSWIAARFDPARNSLYWPVLFLTMLPALPYAVWRTYRAPVDERRRVRIMVAGLALGLAPDLLETFAEAVVPAFVMFVQTPRGRLVVLLAVNLPLLTVPFVTAYAVLVQHALELRSFVRRAIQYALARSTLSVAATLPLLAGVVLLYARRDEPLATLAVDGTGTAVVVAMTAAFLALRLRSRMLLYLDRRFFREQYDARAILGRLVERIRHVSGNLELQALLRQQVAAALHVEATDLLLRDGSGAGYTSADGRIRPLSSASSLVRRLDAAGAPLVVDWGWPSQWVRALPAADQQWLSDAGHALLVPVRGADGALAGVLGLSEKLSELPYTRDDQALVGTVADAVALALAAPGMAAPAQAEPEAPAGECRDCGLMHPAAAQRCERCLATLAAAPLPHVLAGKFRLLERIGRGAMGVVYRARDLALERDVAIKTLPVTSATEAARLRREARAMAAVSHPTLAAIHGVESSRGMPLLVVEYLPKGTLADRLVLGRLPAGEALAVAEPLAHGLARLHEAGILHRDVKPSNIGFTAEGHPKLLDFGIARAVAQPEESAVPLTPRFRRRGSVRRTPPVGSSSGSDVGYLAGTPLYLSPEAIRGEPADPSVDLWALCMVLYEAVAGRHPVGAEPSEYMVLLRLSQADLPDVRAFAPDVPAPVAMLLQAELNRDPVRRARSARARGPTANSAREHPRGGVDPCRHPPNLRGAPCRRSSSLAQTRSRRSGSISSGSILRSSRPSLNPRCGTSRWHSTR